MTNIKILSNKLKINTINSYEGHETKSEQMENIRWSLMRNLLEHNGQSPLY